MRKRLTRHAALATATATALAIIAAGCETTDCPLNNVVYSTYGFYAITDEGESQVSILDTLTITAAGTDSVLLNRMVNANGVELPVSYSAAVDTLIFHFTDTLSRTRRDTIWIEKENIPHYESPTCPASMFHHVTGVRCTHRLIDSVQTVNPNINYNVSENFKIYFRNSY